MIAVLLCAGFGTRLYPLTRHFPKPLLPLAGRPALDYLADQLADLPGLQGVHVVTNHRFCGFFRQWLRARRRRSVDGSIDWQLLDDGVVNEQGRLGACGDLLLAFRALGGFPAVLVAGGDNIFRFPILPLWRRFLDGRGHFVLALKESDTAVLRRSGVPTLGRKNRVLTLAEKPLLPSSGWICPPLYFLRPSAVSALEGFMGTFERRDALGLFIDHLCRVETVSAFKLEACRLDIGSPETYTNADRVLQLEGVYRTWRFAAP
jgi:NDP-sugar pyrophosphorylase family protein